MKLALSAIWTSSKLLTLWSKLWNWIIDKEKDKNWLIFHSRKENETCWCFSLLICVCVRDRERERRVPLCVRVCVCERVCVRATVRVWKKERERKWAHCDCVCVWATVCVWANVCRSKHCWQWSSKGRGREKDENLIQSRVKYTKLMNIMVIQMNGAMRKINY